MTGLGGCFQGLGGVDVGSKGPCSHQKAWQGSRCGGNPLAEKPDRCRVASTSHQHLVCFWWSSCGRPLFRLLGVAVRSFRRVLRHSARVKKHSQGSQGGHGEYLHRASAGCRQRARGYRRLLSVSRTPARDPDAVVSSGWRKLAWNFDPGSCCKTSAAVHLGADRASEVFLRFFLRGDDV